MAPTVRLLPDSANGTSQKVLTVYRRYGTLKRVKPNTARAYFSGSQGPLSDVKTMAAVAARCGRMDMVESILQQIRAVASQNTRTVDELLHEAQRADIREDDLEEDFREKKCVKTWRAWARAMRHCMALMTEQLTAGDEEYRA